MNHNAPSRYDQVDILETCNNARLFSDIVKHTVQRGGGREGRDRTTRTSYAEYGEMYIPYRGPGAVGRMSRRRGPVRRQREDGRKRNNMEKCFGGYSLIFIAFQEHQGSRKAAGGDEWFPGSACI